MAQSDGIFRDWEAIARQWAFVEHDIGLDNRSAFHGIYLTSLRALRQLAETLGFDTEAKSLGYEIIRLTAAARREFFDPIPGIMVSGPERQISHASQIWGILGGVLTPEEGRRALRQLDNFHAVRRPLSPYLHHYWLEALVHCGEMAAARRLICDYWGKMVEYGADTFWEVFQPDDPNFSPYGDSRLNSACHAWSGTPGYFIRFFVADAVQKDKLPAHELQLFR